MIHLLYKDQLEQIPDLAQDMFEDRADQFHTRLKWDVRLDGDGAELDQYDALNPLYLILSDAQSGHLGSMRFLPTTGRTMVNEHFADLLGGSDIVSPRIWECTRFCLSPRLGTSGRVAARLMAGAMALGLRLGLVGSVGVFDAPMLRVYRRLGWGPEVMGMRDGIRAGIWAYDETVVPTLLRASGWSRRYVDHQIARWII